MSIFLYWLRMFHQNQAMARYRLRARSYGATLGFYLPWIRSFSQKKPWLFNGWIIPQFKVWPQNYGVRLRQQLRPHICSIEVENAVAFGIFPVIFTQNDSCEMSMCISIAQTHTKRLSRYSRPAFSLYMSTPNGACDMSMCISRAQARTKRVSPY